MHRLRLTAALILLGLTLTGATVRAQGRLFIEPRLATDSTGPAYSGAVLVGNTLYVSGLGGGAGGTAEEEATRALEAMRKRLQAAKMSMDDLVFVQVFCTDLSLYEAFNRSYRKFFNRELPPRAVVGAGALLFGIRFEVMGIAVRR